MNSLKKANLKYTIDASEPAGDEIFDLAAFVSYYNNNNKHSNKLLLQKAARNSVTSAA